MTEEPVNSEEPVVDEEKDLETREREFMEKIKKEHATSNSWRARQLRRAAGNPNDFYRPFKNKG